MRGNNLENPIVSAKGSMNRTAKVRKMQEFFLIYQQLITWVLEIGY